MARPVLYLESMKKTFFLILFGCLLTRSALPVEIEVLKRSASTEEVPLDRLMQAAEKGDAEAQAALGSKYMYGDGVEKNDATAFQWFLKAAPQGNADAQLGLGTLYQSGRNVPENFVEAFRWLDLAAAQGLEEASEARELLARHLTSSEIRQAQSSEH